MSDFVTTEDLDISATATGVHGAAVQAAGQRAVPRLIELHGGAWCNGDLNECQIYAEGLARAGLAVAAIDFRHAADGYPTSLADINYAIRWVKAHAAS